jgi:hypothetical protein
VRDGIEIGNDDLAALGDDACRSVEELRAEDGRLYDRGASTCGGAAQRALLGVGAAAASGLYVGAVLVGLRSPVVQQRVGPGQGGSSTEKDREEEPGN